MSAQKPSKQAPVSPLNVVDVTGTIVGRLIQVGVAAREIGGEWVALELDDRGFKVVSTWYTTFHEAPNCEGPALVENDYQGSLPKVGRPVRNAAGSVILVYASGELSSRTFASTQVVDLVDGTANCASSNGLKRLGAFASVELPPFIAPLSVR